MHWIEKWRRENIGPEKKGGWMDEMISMGKLAAKVRAQGACCSADLIAILENQNGAITHPNIANAIARVCDATPEQRDGIVAEQHRGTWVRPRKKHRSEFKVRPAPMSVGVLPASAKAVVQISAAGVEMARYDSMLEAANAAGCTVAAVNNRAARKMGAKTNEFFQFDCTWRFAEEWDAMTQIRKIADVLMARGRTAGELEEVLKRCE